MSDLVVSLAFPGGAYNAGGEPLRARAGREPRAEWPPAPERVLAAGLAGQAGTELRVVQSLYELDPPLVVAPAAGTPRNGRYVHWVPRQAETMIAGEKYGQNIDKHGDNTGVLVDPHARVLLVWRDGAHHADPEGLGRAFRRVPYLGRPTSPVVIDVAVHDDGLSQDLLARCGSDPQVYIPDPAGTIQLSVGTPAVLRARDAAHAVQASAPGVNVPNVPISRAWARYRLTSLAHEPACNLACAPDLARDRVRAGRRAAYDLVASGTWFPAATTWPQTAVGQLVAAARRCGASWTLPVIDDGRVLGVLADVDRTHPESRAGLLAVLGSRVVQVAPSAGITPRAVDVLRDYLSTSTTWTTDQPITPGPDLPDAIRALAPRTGPDAGAEVVHALSHDEPLGRATLMPPPGSVNITVVFDRPVTGPLRLDDVFLIPTRSADPSPDLELEHA